MRLACAAQAGGSRYFQHSEHLGVGDDGVLNDLCEPLVKLASRQRFQNIDVIDHEGWRVKRADQVFPVRRVYSGFSTDGAVHHCQQRRGNLNVWNAAMIDCSYQSGNVTNNSTAKTDYKRLAIKPCSNHPVANPANLLERL